MPGPSSSMISRAVDALVRIATNVVPPGRSVGAGIAQQVVDDLAEA